MRSHLDDDQTRCHLAEHSLQPRRHRRDLTAANHFTVFIQNAVVATAVSQIYPDRQFLLGSNLLHSLSFRSRLLALLHDSAILLHGWFPLWHPLSASLQELYLLPRGAGLLIPSLCRVHTKSQTNICPTR